MAVKEKAKVRIKTRYLVVTAMVAVVCVAVYLNWRYNTAEPTTPVSDSVVDSSKNLGESRLVNADGTVNTEALDALTQEAAEDAGGTAGSGYFTQARLSRQKARDEAREVLSGMMSDPDCDDDTRRQASQEIGVLASCITMEADIETLVLAKGFEECLAVVTNSGASLIVKTPGLETSQVAQLKEIVMDATKMSADKIKLVEVK